MVAGNAVDHGVVDAVATCNFGADDRMRPFDFVRDGLAQVVQQPAQARDLARWRAARLAIVAARWAVSMAW